MFGFPEYNIFGEEIKDMKIVKINHFKHALKITFKEGVPFSDFTLYASEKDVNNIKRRFTDYPKNCYRIELERENMLLTTSETFKRSAPFVY